MEPAYVMVRPNATRDGIILSRKLVLPPEIDALVPPGQRFRCTVDEQGIHLTPSEIAEPDIELPSLARKPGA